MTLYPDDLQYMGPDSDGIVRLNRGTSPQVEVRFPSFVGDVRLYRGLAANVGQGDLRGWEIVGELNPNTYLRVAMSDAEVGQVSGTNEYQPAGTVDLLHDHGGLAGSGGAGNTNPGGTVSTDNAGGGNTDPGGTISTDNAGGGNTDPGGTASTDNDGAFSGDTGGGGGFTTSTPVSGLRSVTDDGTPQVDVADKDHEHSESNHDHPVTIGSHDHAISQHAHNVVSHDHDIQDHVHNVVSHDHDIQNHDHPLPNHGDHEIDPDLADGTALELDPIEIAPQAVSFYLIAYVGVTV